MFSTADTIVAIATPPGRGGIGVVRVSGPDVERIARALTGRDEPLEPRRATLSGVSRRRRADRPRRLHPVPCSPVVHRRERPRDQRPRQSGAAAGDRRGGNVRRRPARGAGRVHASRVSERSDRSRAGRGGAGSDRCGHAAAGAHGLRSARGHADGPYRGRGPHAVRSECPPRGVAGFRRRRVPLHRPGGGRGGDRSARSTRWTTCSATWTVDA